MPKNSKNLNDHIDKLMNYLDQGADESSSQESFDEIKNDKNTETTVSNDSTVFAEQTSTVAQIPAYVNMPYNESSGIGQRNDINILMRRKWVIIITAMAILVIVAIGLLIAPPVYEATSKIRIMTATSGGKDYVNYDLTYTERLMQTYTEIAKSVPVTTELLSRMNVTTVKELPTVTISIIPDTELLAITAEDVDPQKAMQAANILSDILISRSAELFSKTSVESVTLMEAAILPLVPTKPNKPLFLGVGFLLGIAAGIALAFLVEGLDTLLYSIDQIESATKLPMVGDIPEYRHPMQNGELILDNKLHSEAFRRLRTNILFSSKSKGFHTYLITSAVKGDGKSTIIANLAISIAKTGRKVLVIDADLRDSTLHKLLKTANERGLTDVLVGQAEYTDVVQKTEFEGVDLVPGGQTPDDPAEVLGKPSLPLLLKHYEAIYDIILIDVAGSLTVTDPVVIAPFVDGVLLVVRLSYVRRDALTGTLKNLRNINANLIGVIVNRTLRGVGTQLDKRIEKTKGELAA